MVESTQPDKKQLSSNEKSEEVAKQETKENKDLDVSENKMSKR